MAKPKKTTRSKSNICWSWTNQKLSVVKPDRGPWSWIVQLKVWILKKELNQTRNLRSNFRYWGSTGSEIDDAATSSNSSNAFATQNCKLAELLREEDNTHSISMESYLIFDEGATLATAPLIHGKRLKRSLFLLKQKKIDEIQSQKLYRPQFIEKIFVSISRSRKNSSSIQRILNTCLLQQFKRSRKISELTTIVTASPRMSNERTGWGCWTKTRGRAYQTLLSYQLNPVSISTNVFPMLAIAGDYEAIREAVH